MFRDRTEAGDQLGATLADALPRTFPDGPALPAVVLAIPRGGAIVGGRVANALGVALDVVVPRKLGAPGNPELGVGAVAPGVQVIDRSSTRALGVSEDYLDRETARQLAEIDRRVVAYRGDRAPLDLDGTLGIVVDDGVATGVTAVAALRWARAQGAARVVFAAPVGPAGIEERLASECDRCIVLVTPRNLRAVGQWYEMFEQTTDEEVRAALEAHAP